MAEMPTCPACERPDCSCPVCNGSGRARGRGYSTPCHHCRGVLIERLRDSLAAALKVVEETDTLRRYFASRGVCLPALDRFDAARSELARLVQEKPLQQGDD